MELLSTNFDEVFITSSEKRWEEATKSGSGEVVIYVDGDAFMDLDDRIFGTAHGTEFPVADLGDLLVSATNSFVLWGEGVIFEVEDSEIEISTRPQADVPISKTEHTNLAQLFSYVGGPSAFSDYSYEPDTIRLFHDR